MALTPEEKAALISTLDEASKAQYDKLTPKEKDVKLERLAQVQIAQNNANALVAGLGNKKTNTQSAGTGTYKDVLKLTPESAKLLLTQAAQDAQFTGTLSKADIADFTAKFQAEAQKQMAIVVKQAQDSQTVGAKPEDLTKSISDAVTTNFPSFFKADTFAKDYIWTKINFKDEASLGGKALTALAQARKVVSDFHLIGISDAEVQVAAKQIAMGKKSINDYTAEVQKVAMKEYPTLADRFKLDPTLTTKDIVNPVVKMLAKNWEVPESDISMNDPYIMSYLHPTSADGKGQPPTYADLYYKSLKDPKREYTVAANDEARQAATSLARAFGAGI